MNKKWSFVSNHGKIFAYIYKHPANTTPVISQDTGLSIRAVQKIIDDLENDGYLDRRKIGRCNHYIIHPERQVRPRMELDHTIGEIMLTLIGKS